MSAIYRWAVVGPRGHIADDRFCNIREIAMAKFSASPAIRERYKDWQTRDWADFERDGYRVARFKLVECATEERDEDGE